MSHEITNTSVKSNQDAASTISITANENSDNASLATYTISQAQYMQFLVAQRIAREFTLAKKMKEHNAIFASRRNTVALRRVDAKAIAPDLDVLAYIEICKMKEANSQDATASDAEIAAYVKLWNSDGILNLDAINQSLQAANA